MKLKGEIMTYKPKEHWEKEDIENEHESIPFWLKSMGRLSRSIPNLYKVKEKLMWILMPKIRSKGYKTIIKYDLGQKIFLNLDDWIPIQMFWMGFYFVERKETE